MEKGTQLFVLTLASAFLGDLDGRTRRGERQRARSEDPQISQMMQIEGGVILISPAHLRNRRHLRTNPVLRFAGREDGTGSCVECDIADPVQQMVCEGRHPGTCVPGSLAGFAGQKQGRKPIDGGPG